MARPRKDPDEEILIASDSGVWRAPSGEEFYFHKDATLVRAGHPLVKANPDSFKPLRVHYELASEPAKVEQATAAPGEKRDW